MKSKFNVNIFLKTAVLILKKIKISIETPNDLALYDVRMCEAKIYHQRFHKNGCTDFKKSKAIWGNSIRTRNDSFADRIGEAKI